MALTSPGIIKASNDALVAVKPAINVINTFAYNASNEFVTPGTTVKIPVAKAGTLAAFGQANDFENADGTLAWESVELSDTVKSTFEIGQADKLNMPLDSYWGTIAEAAANGVVKYISDKIGDLFNDNTLSTTCTLSGDLTAKKAAKLRKECVGRVDETVLILKPEWYADVMGDLDSAAYGTAAAYQDGKVDKLFGFKAVVEGRNLPDGVNGVLIPRDCLVIASRAFAVADESCYSEYGTATDEENGFTLTTLRHGSAKTGGAFINVAALFGLKLIQKDSIKLIKNS